MNSQRTYRRALSHQRSAVTILEVLFSILVATIGLLGAVAVIPVAASQARKGQIADASAVTGLSAIHEFDARGMRNTQRWFWWDGNAYQGASTFFGGSSSYCIDPRFVADNAISGTSTTFPYGASGIPAMPRLNLTSSAAPPYTSAMSSIQANVEFACDDDLVVLEPTDRSLPAAQQYPRDDTQTILSGRRQTGGLMSWFATITPKLDRYHSATTATNEYLLSIVVLKSRPINLRTSDYGDQEWTVNITAFNSIGQVGGHAAGASVALRGGDIQISAPTAEMLDIKRDQWIMLAGTATVIDPATGTAGSFTANRFQWYRVTDLDDEPVNNGANWVRDITIAGQDWNTDLNGDSSPDPCIAVIVRDVTAVYEKTIRLETN